MSRAWVAVALLLLAGSPGVAAAETLGEVFKRVNPAVVIVRTVEREAAAGGGLATVPGVGSGVLVSDTGLVVTASHVVHSADEVTAEFLDGSQVAARVVASEPEADLALLRLERVPANAVVARLGDSDSVQVGDPVFIVGAPYGIGHTLTVGHVSARHRPNTVWGEMSLAEFIQTDAAINQGNSGGPMFSMGGDVVGIVSHIISKSGGFEGLGFVVTSNMARRLLLEERAFWTGLQGLYVEGALARALNLPQDAGLLVQRVAERSPAAVIGLRGGTVRATVDGRPMLLGGDVILEVHGIPVGEVGAYTRIRAHQRGLQPGDPVSLVVLRDGRRVALTGRLPGGRRP